MYEEKRRIEHSKNAIVYSSRVPSCMVELVDPDIGQKICDPSCGTGRLIHAIAGVKLLIDDRPPNSTP
jgi:tRNA G10  N-methylase Trm11